MNIYITLADLDLQGHWLHEYSWRNRLTPCLLPPEVMKARKTLAKSDRAGHLPNVVSLDDSRAYMLHIHIYRDIYM